MRIIPSASVGGYEGETQRILGFTAASIWNALLADHVVAASFGPHIAALGSAPAINPLWVGGVSDGLTSLGVVDIVNVTEAGVLIAITLHVSGAVTGSPVSVLEWDVDGEGTQTMSVYSGLNLFRREGVLNFANQGISPGSAVGDRFWIPLNIRYGTSLRVSHNLTTVAAGGSIHLGVLRGVEL